MPHKDPDERREYQRAWRRQYRQRNREKIREDQRLYYQANRERIRARHQRSRKAKPERATERLRIHGIDDARWAEIWTAQGGCCYLCGRSLEPDATTVVDHSHDCCPAGSSCVICQRGLVHRICNQMIGLAGDDAARLRRAADALDAANRAVADRRATMPRQELLFADWQTAP